MASIVKVNSKVESIPGFHTGFFAGNENLQKCIRYVYAPVFFIMYMYMQVDLLSQSALYGPLSGKIVS